jgi:hypothetical protein
MNNIIMLKFANAASKIQTKELVPTVLNKQHYY